jgi:hypothetical protein
VGRYLPNEKPRRRAKAFPTVCKRMHEHRLENPNPTARLPMQAPQVMRIVKRRTRQMHCSDFCSDSTIKRTHPDAAAHTLFLELNALSSEALLSRNMLREVGLMSWAQEVRGSNPRAPTTNSLN